MARERARDRLGRGAGRERGVGLVMGHRNSEV